MESLQDLAAELAITATNGSVWLAIGQGLLFGAVCLLFGVWVARFVGFLESDTPAGETLGVGLACGLLVVAACWAAIASGGRSSFTPVAVGFAAAVALAIASHFHAVAEAPIPATLAGAIDERTTAPSSQRRSTFATCLGGAIFIIGVALLYGSTMAPSPRDGAQPIEFTDEAYYSILGADLARTGIEATYAPSGFPQIAGVPPQMWYHWGEIWLASAIIKIFGTAPIAARFFVVLPVVLLAAAAMTGTLVRRMTPTSSRRAFAFGFLACLFLAPIPLIPGPFFSAWPAGMIFGITIYGVAAVVVLLGFYSLSILAGRKVTWALATFVGSAFAIIVPTHLVIAILVALGVGSVWAVRVVRSLRATGRPPVIPAAWRRTLVITGFLTVATIFWGWMTSHGVGPSSSPPVAPFNDVWRDSIAITTLNSGVFFAIAAAWVLVRREAHLQADLFLGTGIVLLIGAIVWGARLSDFTMFYFLYAGIAVVATPVAAIAAWMLLIRLRAAPHVRVTVVFAVLCVIQLELGVFTGLRSMRQFGAHFEAPISMSLLSSIQQLPPDAKLAFACQPLDEGGFVGSTLLSIDAHTSRRVVPMCFEAEVLDALIGLPISVNVENAFFKWAPQRTLYPDATAHPSSEEVAAFLKSNGIDYIYADERHPNSLVPDAVLVASSGGGQVLKIP